MSRFSFVLLLAAAAWAAPTIRDIQPRGAQRGKTFTLKLRGDGLAQGAKLQTTLPAGISRLVELERPNAELPFLVELKPDAPVGLYPLRLLTDDGISNVVLFSVTDLPEAEENESKNPKQTNNTPEEAETLAIPSVVNGTLTQADEDWYAFSAKAGQKLVFEVEARRAGSAIDPAIEIFDSSGRLIAKNDDAPGIGVDSRVEVTFPKAGQYRVRVHDSRYSDQVQNFYRLKAGWWPYAEALFPLGGPRGTSVELVGGNLPALVKTVAQASACVLPGSQSPPLLFSLSDTEELSEGAPLKEGAVMNGRISKPGEIDRYPLAVKPGEQWFFELLAAQLGSSQLDGILTVYDTHGKKLASRDDLAGADPALPFTVPANVNEIVVAVEDVLGRGGPAFGYRLQARRQPPDFVVDLATPFVNVPAGGTAQVVAIVQRRGYDGPLRVTVPNLPPGFRQAGGHVPSEATAQDFKNDNAGFRTARTVITITADPDVTPQFLELAVVGKADGIERYARGPGLVTAVRGDRQRAFTAPWLGMQLALGVSKPLPVALTLPVPAARFAQGFEWPLQYRIERRGVAKAPANVRNQVAGSVGNLRILKSPPGKSPDAGAVLVATNFATPVATFDMLFEATVDVDGRQVTVSSPAVSIEVVPGYQIELEKSAVLEIRGKVYREPTFEGSLIRLQAEDLPERVKCAPVEVSEKQTQFVMSCEAPPGVKPGAYDIRITSVAPDTGRKAKDEYRIPDLNAKLMVAGK